MGLFIRSSMSSAVEIFGVSGGPRPHRPACGSIVAAARVLHGNRTYLLMDDDGQISGRAFDLGGPRLSRIGPEHSWLHERPGASPTCPRPMRKRSPHSSAVAARGHHSGAGASARHRQGDELAPNRRAIT